MSHGKDVAAPPKVPFRWSHLAVWLPLCLVHGVAVAWVAFSVQEAFAPLGLFPLLVGAVVGVTLGGLMRLVQVAGRTVVLAGVLASCGVAVVGQHYFSYRQDRDEAQEQAAKLLTAARLHPDLVQGTPPEPAKGLIEYLRWQAIGGRPIVGDVVARGGWAWVSWVLDGMLTLLAALLVVAPALWQPYCEKCRSWYRTARRGRLDPAVAAEVATAAGIELPEDVAEVQYRLVGCEGGCGMSGFELCWELPGGCRKSARLWLAAEDRARLERSLSLPNQTSDNTG